MFTILNHSSCARVPVSWISWHFSYQTYVKLLTQENVATFLEHVQWGPTHASSLNVPDGAWLGSHHKREINILVLRYTWGKALCTDFITLLETVAIRHRMWPTLPDFGPVSHKPAEEVLQTTGLKRCNIHTLTTPHRVTEKTKIELCRNWAIIHVFGFDWKLRQSANFKKTFGSLYEVTILLSPQWYIFQFVWFEKFKRKIRLAYIAI